MYVLAACREEKFYKYTCMYVEMWKIILGMETNVLWTTNTHTYT